MHGKTSGVNQATFWLTPLVRPAYSHRRTAWPSATTTHEAAQVANRSEPAANRAAKAVAGTLGISAALAVALSISMQYTACVETNVQSYGDDPHLLPANIAADTHDLCFDEREHSELAVA